MNARHRFVMDPNTGTTVEELEAPTEHFHQDLDIEFERMYTDEDCDDTYKPGELDFNEQR